MEWAPNWAFRSKMSKMCYEKEDIVSPDGYAWDSSDIPWTDQLL